MLVLRDFNKEDIENEFLFLKDALSEGEFVNPYSSFTYEEFEEIAVPERIRSHKGQTEVGSVPDTWYFLYDGLNIVSVFQFRHFLTKRLERENGHITFYTKKDKRNMGYAKEGLKMLINLIKPHMIPGEDKLYFRIQKNDEVSLGILKSQGAYVHDQDLKYIYLRIRVIG